MYDLKYPHLFSPYSIRGKTFKNRILVAPIGAAYFSDRYYSREDCRVYEDIAMGGAARVCVSEAPICPGSANRNMLVFYEEPNYEFCTGMRALTEACHRHGALAFVEFTHNGIYMKAASEYSVTGQRYAGGPPVDPPPKNLRGEYYELPDAYYGPSEMILKEPYDGVTSGERLRHDQVDGRHIRAMSLAQMDAIADQYAFAAGVAKYVGFDGCIIHGGHGFLFSQWISRRLNHRTDEYGGSIENRSRFPIMCMQRMRDTVGEDFIIELRFSGEENISPISDRKYLEDVITLDDTVGFFRELDKCPGLCDIAHISGGVHTVPLYNTRSIANSLYPMGVNVDCAAAVRAAVKNMAVGVVGSLSDPALCERIVAEGKADFVIMARQLYSADPYFPQKARAGEDEQIDNCLRCVSCRNPGCSVNPVEVMDRPLFARIQKAEVSRKVVVIGAGVAGLKAAETAARRGHSVVVFEKSGRTGGVLRYTDNDPYKTDVKRYMAHMEQRVRKLGVELRLDTEATPELVEKEAPFAVIAAVGGKTRVPPIPGLDGPQVMDAVAAYMAPERTRGLDVVVLGGSITGCEAAIWLADHCRSVTVVGRNKSLMPHQPAEHSNTHRILLADKKVVCLTDCVCTAVTQAGVAVTHEGQEKLLPCGAVVNALGVDADKESANAFAGCAPLFFAVGDCVSPGQIGDAVKSAYYAALDI